MNDGFPDGALFDVNLALFDYDCAYNCGAASVAVELACERTPLPSALLSCIRGHAILAQTIRATVLDDIPARRRFW